MNTNQVKFAQELGKAAVRFSVDNATAYGTISAMIASHVADGLKLPEALEVVKEVGKRLRKAGRTSSVAAYATSIIACLAAGLGVPSGAKVAVKAATYAKEGAAAKAGVKPENWPELAAFKDDAAGFVGAVKAAIEQANDADAAADALRELETGEWSASQPATVYDELREAVEEYEAKGGSVAQLLELVKAA